MMVGDPFSGKTQVLQVLAETLNVLTDRGYDDENVNKVPVSKQTYNKRSISLSYKTSLIPTQDCCEVLAWVATNIYSNVVHTEKLHGIKNSSISL